MVCCQYVMLIHMASRVQAAKHIENEVFRTMRSMSDSGMFMKYDDKLRSLTVFYKFRRSQAVLIVPWGA
jgi:hypothetical protein